MLDLLNFILDLFGIGQAVSGQRNEQGLGGCPAGHEPMAMLASYLGLLSILGIFAPFGILFGVLALRNLRQQPHLLGAGRAWFGVVMGTAFSVIYGVAFLT